MFNFVKHIPHCAPSNRVRNPVTPSRITVRGQFPSKKMQRMIAWESQLERRACYLFEFSSNVIAFREQPERIHVPYINKVRRYTPDFEVIKRTGEVCYYEIKPLKRLHDQKDYFNCIHHILQERGIGFFVLTEKELLHPIREQNLILLRQYQSMVLSSIHLQQIVDLYTESESLHLPLEYLKNKGFNITTIYSYLANNSLICNLDQEINEHTSITLNTAGELNETELFQHRSAPYF